MPANRISLASGVVPEFGPLETISAAASGGIDAVGLWIEPPAWTPQLLQDVKACLSGSGLELLGVEVDWLKPGTSRTMWLPLRPPCCPMPSFAMHRRLS
jgi:hypothetical protein